MTSTIPKLYEGTPTITVNDNRGLSVRQIQYNRTEAAAERDTLITRSVFNEMGNPTSFMDPRFFEKGQNNQSQAHNLAGQTLRIDSVDAGWRVALLDIEGAVHKEWNAHGTERRYEYDDELHRPIAIYEKNDDINNGVEQVTERFVYGTQKNMSNNLNLHLTRHYDLGGLSETDGISLSGGPLSQQRRLLKDVTAESNWKGEDESTWQSVLDTSIFKSKWTYNALGVQLTLQDAKSNIQRSEYGVSGQLVATYYQAIGKAEFAVLSSITYNANGQVLTETAGNGVVSCYTYDERDWRLVQVTTTRPTKEGRNAQLQMLNYGYDPVGNIISIKDSAQATRFYKNQRIDPELTYTYDALYQLLTASGRENDAAISTSSLPSALIPLTDSHQYNGYTRQYHYDRSGNLESVQHSGVSNYTQSMVISDTSNRVVQQTVNSPIRADNVNDYFDVHGNLKKLEHNKELSWGRYDQLKRVELTAQQSEVYQYTTQGERIRKVLLDTGNSTETEVIYLPGLELRITTNITNDSVKEELLVSVLMNTGRNQVRVQHWKVGLPSGLSNDQCRYSIDNHLGSSNLELDSEANILTQEEYYPFGGTAVWSAKSATEAKYKYVRYSGKERDATGLYYYGYRYYMPWMGRWLNPDPAWNIDGLNLYRMVRNNPVVLQDTNGLSPSFSCFGPSRKERNLRREIDGLINQWPDKEIPKHIHLIWVGTKNISDQNIVKSKKTASDNTDYNITVYYDGNIEGHSGDNLGKVFQESKIKVMDLNNKDYFQGTDGAREMYNKSINDKKYAQASDVLRLVILRTEGGIYKDIDDTSVTGFGTLSLPSGIGVMKEYAEEKEKKSAIPNTPIASVPNHPVINNTISKAVDNYNGGIEDVFDLAGPNTFTDMMYNEFSGLKIGDLKTRLDALEKTKGKGLTSNEVGEVAGVFTRFRSLNKYVRNGSDHSWK